MVRTYFCSNQKLDRTKNPSISQYINKMPSNTFEYILIPSNTNENIISKTGYTSGGLQDDYLIKSAKEYFAARRDSTASAMTG